MANLYSVENLLEGKAYRSRTLEGIIQSAEKRSDVWYDGAEAYLVRVRPYVGNVGIVSRDTYRTIAVKTQD